MRLQGGWPSEYVACSQIGSPCTSTRRKVQKYLAVIAPPLRKITASRRYSASGSGPGSDNLEVEARVRGATRPGFEKLLGHLVGNPAWTHAEFRETRAYTLPGKERLILTRIVAPGTVAAAAAAGIPSKGSTSVPAPPGHTAAPGSWEQETKGKGSPVDFTVQPVAEIGYFANSAAQAAATASRVRGPRDARCGWAELRRLGQVRMQAAVESTPRPAAPSREQVASLDRDSFQRIKRRWSFVHKAEVRYDLTEVQEGRSAAQANSAPPNYEVELEWVGSKATPPADAADKLLFKVADVLVFLARHANETASAAFVEAARRGCALPALPQGAAAAAGGDASAAKWGGAHPAPAAPAGVPIRGPAGRRGPAAAPAPAAARSAAAAPVRAQKRSRDSEEAAEPAPAAVAEPADAAAAATSPSSPAAAAAVSAASGAASPAPAATKPASPAPAPADTEEPSPKRPAPAAE